MKHILLILALMACMAGNAQSAAQRGATRKTTPVTKVTKKATATQTTQRRQVVRQRPVYKDVNYVIEGNANGYDNGQWVRLCTPSPSGLLAYDSTKVEGGRFSFKGVTKNVPHMQYVTIGEGLQKNITEVLLEQGTIKMDLVAGKKEDRVTGTTHNDIYTPYRDSLNDIYTKLYACLTEGMKLTNSQEDRESYKAGADMLRNKIVSVSYDFANKNMTNWVGVYLFAEYYKRFTPQQNKTLLAKMQKKYGNLPITAEIRKYVNKQK